jgi:hypothetical protein
LVERKAIMEPDEIRAEIQRRKKRATDLKLREILWSLYNSHFRRYTEQLKKDSELVYPEIQETLEISNTHIQFCIGETTYRLVYKEGPQERESDWVPRRRGILDETTITPATLALQVDGARVFDFKIQKSVSYTPEMPIFDETMGEITSFIEGPWVTDVAELLQKIRLHEKAVWDKRQAPKLQQKLREDMKRFGL